MTDRRSYDVIVVGLGAMGSATLFHLARRRVRVLGIEQFMPGHTFGSSHGDSRIIRETYFEHPLYVPLVQRAHQLWRDLEEVSQTPLMKITGGLMIGPLDGMVISGTLRSVREHRLPHELLSPEEVRKRFPAFQLVPDLSVVFDPRAGHLHADACNRAHLKGATAAGAQVRAEEKVVDWSVDGEGVEVRTKSETYRAAKLVLAAGPWNLAMTPGLALPLTVERQTVVWFEPPRTSPPSDEYFPIYAYESKPGTICYGFPALPRGMKASIMHDGAALRDPNDVDRKVGDHEVRLLRAALRPVIPDLSAARVPESGAGLFTNTPDHDFIIDFHPEFPQVLISSPCSGHGFKFASAVGELQSELLTTDKTRFDLTPFSGQRFLGGVTSSRYAPSKNL